MTKSLLALLLSATISLTACGSPALVEPDDDASAQTSSTISSEISSSEIEGSEQNTGTSESAQTFSLADLPAYSGGPYIAVNNNVPYFSETDFSTTSFEEYSELDSLGRCGVAYANIGQDLMPTEERGSIGQIKPTGWHTVKYDNVDGKYLYNRCHLIGYQLTAENANEKNLITGTRYLNVTGMLPFENMVADYIKETNNHVLYRVTPVFEGNNLVANGVLMEAMSVEDKGESIEYNVFCYNVQPGISIDYATGDSHADGNNVAESSSSAVTAAPAIDKTVSESTASSSESSETYILNTNSKKFHKLGCGSIAQMKDSNKKEFSGSRDELLSQGYDPCKRCNP